MGSWRPLRKDLATTYSRGTYRTTTIGKTVFDGRVRKGIGSGHSFITTKNQETGEELGDSGLTARIYCQNLKEHFADFGVL